MNSTRTGRWLVGRLWIIRNEFDAACSAEKLDILDALLCSQIATGADVLVLHKALCFIRAFPDSARHFKIAGALLSQFEIRVTRLSKRERATLADTGIAGTPLHYRFSYEVADWLAGRDPGKVAIDWDEFDDTDRLDELLENILIPPEADWFDSGYVSSEEWITQVSRNCAGTDFDWLLEQPNHRPGRAAWSQLYNAADVPLVWQLRGDAWSKTENFAGRKIIKPRATGMRKPPRHVKTEIKRPLTSLQLLPRRAGAKLIDVAMASLAVRHRETYHFNFANPREVYLADVGEGVSVAVFGLRHDHRFPLECTMGYLILSNGSPIGYGGSSILFRQVNTGVNVFDEFRGSEAAFLWVQVMRVYHHLIGCTRFIANPYQFGAGNNEALRSGAFWFYYRLGYRPVEPAVRQLARRESARMHDNVKYRSNLRNLKRLASCDLQLTLTGSRASELFEERWIETSSMLATEVLAGSDMPRTGAVENVMNDVLQKLGARGTNGWSPAEKSACGSLAPFVAACNPADWHAAEKQMMVKLLRAKGAEREANYGRLLCENKKFLSTLRRACRRTEV